VENGVEQTMGNENRNLLGSKAEESCFIALTDQASHSIVVLDAGKDWSSEQAVHWSWTPSAGNGFPEPVAGWGNPSDVKLRYSSQHSCLCMLVVDSRGLAAMISYDDKATRLWSGFAKGNLHAAELLPDGNIALAASHGSFVRVYTSSQGADSHHYVEQTLPGGHGVLWDPQLRLLWAVGDEYLTAFSIEGTPSEPVLRELTDMRSTLPSLYGHDLSPVYGSPDLLWVTTNGGVYQYTKSSRTWSDSFELSEQVQHRMVKSVGNFPNGDVVHARPKSGSLHSWTTDIVEISTSEGTKTLVKPEAALYKARVWRADYN
jgi:hypothetical protein